MSDNLNLLLQSRADFFRRYRSERNMSLFLSNETRLISLVSSSQSIDALRNIGISLTSATFLDPVLVAPSQQQLDHAFLTPNPRPDGSCPICQENFDDTAPLVRLRHCNHCFHRDCARTWYRMSVYCPMCRHDIRT